MEANAVSAQLRRIVVSERLVDILTVALISLAAISSAWCGYQAARWSALQALDYNLSGASRVAASTAAERSNAIRLVDVGLFVQFVSATYAHNDGFARFLRRRFTPELARATDAWLATKPLTNPKAPLSPFAMPEYALKSDRDYAMESNHAAALTTYAQEANRRSDEYVFLTVIFASVSFLGGMAPKFRAPMHVVVTILGFALFGVALAMLSGYPVRQ